ncbi:hypothetical protein FQN53_005955 [Emmonsiellopsis sp. PD_33]|nr:hypothetical protein FQN53_005955 [Emmonsiellopsis sp. PD_33]
MVQEYHPVPNQGETGAKTTLEKGNANKVDTYYGNIATVGIIVVLLAIVLMAISAALIARDLSELREIAAALNLGVSIFHIFFYIALWTPLYKPKARNNPTPRAAFVNVLVFSVLIWIPASVLMFLVYGDDDDSSGGYKKLIKRKGGGGGKFGKGPKFSEAIDLLSLWQLWAVYRLHSEQFDPVDIETSACLRGRTARPK